MDRQQRFLYSEEDMAKAIEAVQNGMAKAAASKLYGVPRTTLIGKIQGKVPVERKIGPESVLTKEEEHLLVNWLFHIGHSGFPATKQQLLDSVEMLMKELKRPNPFVNGRPGRKWYQAFLRRHPQLSARVSQNLTNSRASVSEEKIRRWFSEVKSYLKKTGNFQITEYPNRIFNCDETAFFLSPKDDKVLVRKGDKTVYSFINNDEKECLTTLITCSASGDLVPPMIIYSYKRLPKHIVDKVPPKWGIGQSDNGWMTGETFYEYVTNIFHPWLIEQHVELPVILYLDGHVSHLTMALSEFCSNNGIILIALLANSTHILQPLDVAVFRPLKAEWKKSIHAWRMANNGKKLTRDNFAPILNTTLEKMKNIPDVFKSGFRSCGLSPFSPDNINFEKYFKTERIASNSTSHAINGQEKQEFKDFLKYLEKKVPEKVRQFKAAGHVWGGNIEDSSLFTLWREAEDQLSTNELNQEAGEQLEPTKNAEEDQKGQINDPVSLDLKNNSDGTSNLSYTFDVGEDFQFIGELFDSQNNNWDVIKDQGNTSFPDISLLDLEPDASKITILQNVIVKESCDNVLDCEIHEVTPIPNPGNDEVGNKSKNQIYEIAVTNSNSEYKEVKHVSEGYKEDTLEYRSSPNMKCDKDLINIKAMCIETENNTSPSSSNNVAINMESVLKEKNKTNNNNEDFVDSNKTIGGIPVPSPFKKCLFWPTPKPSTSGRRNIREKVPTVASSSDWQEFHRKKDEKRKQLLKEKEQKRKERERKRSDKQHNNEGLNTRKKPVPAKEKLDLKDEGEISNESSPENDVFSVGDFVMVNFNGQNYPGKIVKIDLPENKDPSPSSKTPSVLEEGLGYLVEHMEKKGLNWIWPKMKDHLWYEKEELISKIKSPVLKNKRGLYEVEELSEFV